MFRGSPRRSKTRRCTGIFAVTVLGALTLAPATAQAAFHEILIREVYAGGAANDSYVVLQAYSSGQNALSSHSVTAYDASGNQVGGFTFGGSVDSGQNQMTVLVADTAYTTTFQGGPPPDGSSATLNLNPTGGAACWTGLDCVAWGSFDGDVSPSPGPAASPGGIPAGMALRRTIIGGSCSNRLDLGDDSGDSSADFTLQSPHPRSNASPIDEGSPCIAPQLPVATIDSGPPGFTQVTSASFTYHAAPPGASFECKLDNAAFADCEADGIAYPGPLADGKHAFRVRAKDANGTGTADLHEWTVDTTPPVAEIKTQPKDPSPGNSAAFTYSSNEAGSTFQCSLDSGGGDSFSACASTGRTYTGLANGEYTFKVRATDKAGNQGGSDSFGWEVDNSLADETPPQTTIVSKPPDPSLSSAASFSYESNEPGSTFECKLDGGDFAGCAAAGVAYIGLTNGSHSFQVRARDASGNADASPAGYSWAISALAAIEPPALAPLAAASAPAAASGPPETTITGKPGPLTRDRTPTFRFRSSVAGSTFECKVDRGASRPCSSPFTTKKLTFGAHAVEVRAAVGGAADPSPAKSRFRIAKPKRRKQRP